MSMWKKPGFWIVLVVILAAVVLAVSLLAKPGQEPQQTAPVTTGETLSTTEPVPVETVEPETTGVAEELNGEKPERPAPETVRPLPKADTAEDLVTAAWKGRLRWKDLAGNSCEVAMSIPRIYPFSEDAVRLQDRIWDAMLPNVEKSYESYQDETSAVWTELGWKAYLNGEVLSVVVQQDTDSDWTDYLVCNLDVKTGRELDSTALAERLGMEPDAYRKKAAACADRAFTERFGESGDSEFYGKQRQANQSEENLRQAGLFLDETGKPMLTFSLFSMAGAESYPTIVPLEP